MGRFRSLGSIAAAVVVFFSSIIHANAGTIANHVAPDVLADVEMEADPTNNVIDLTPGSDSLENAGVIQIGNGLLKFLVDHAQAKMEDKYPDLVDVKVGNPMDFNETAFSKEKYINLLGLDDGGVDVSETVVSTSTVAKGPLYFKCPNLGSKWLWWDVEKLNSGNEDFAGKLQPADDDYNPMGCTYVVKYQNIGSGQDGTKHELELSFAVENVHWNLDVSNSSPGLVNKEESIANLIEETSQTRISNFDLCTVGDTTMTCDDADGSVMDATVESISDFGDYDAAQHQFVRVDGDLDLGFEFQLVLSVTCDKDEDTCPDWFGEFADGLEEVSDGDYSGDIEHEGNSKTKFVLRIPLGLDAIRPDLWGQMTLAEGMLELSNLYLKSFDLEGLVIDIDGAAGFLAGFFKTMFDNTRLGGWGGVIRTITPDEVFDWIYDGLSIVLDAFESEYPHLMEFLLKYANESIAKNVHDVMIADLNTMTTLPLAGEVDLAPANFRHVNSDEPSTNFKLTVTSQRSAATGCAPTAWPELDEPAGTFSEIAVGDDADVIIGLSKQAVSSVINTALYNEDWCSEVKQEEDGLPCPTCGDGTATLATDAEMNAYPEFSWGSGILKTVSPSSTARKASHDEGVEGAEPEIDPAATAIAYLSFADAGQAVSGHAKLTDGGAVLFSADYQGGFKAYFDIVTDDDGTQWLEVSDIEWDGGWQFINTQFRNKELREALEGELDQLTDLIQSRLETSITETARVEIPDEYEIDGFDACLGEIAFDEDYMLLPVSFAEPGACPSDITEAELEEKLDDKDDIKLDSIWSEQALSAEDTSIVKELDSEITGIADRINP